MLKMGLEFRQICTVTKISERRLLTISMKMVKEHKRQQTNQPFNQGTSLRIGLDVPMLPSKKQLSKVFAIVLKTRVRLMITVLKMQ